MDLKNRHAAFVPLSLDATEKYTLHYRVDVAYLMDNQTFEEYWHHLVEGTFALGVLGEAADWAVAGADTIIVWQGDPKTPPIELEAPELCPVHEMWRSGDYEVTIKANWDNPAASIWTLDVVNLIARRVQD